MFNTYKEIDFSDFKDRELNLSKIYRWYGFYDFVHRTNDLFHSHKVFCLVSKAISMNIDYFIENKFDIEKIQIMALIHDDIEILIGDYPAYKKVNISKEKLSVQENKEKNSIEELSNIFPEFIGIYEYKKLLEEIEEKNTFDSQFIKYFDHIDGMCEYLHELFGKNETFIEMPTDNEGIKLPGGQRHYQPKISNPGKYYPLVKDFLDNIGFNYNIELYDEKETILNGKKHAKDNIEENRGHKIYDWRKKTLFEKLDNEEISLLWKDSDKRFYK